ncbi:hypothetical protein CJ030_MR6G016503 [Morella rubra]|uniref:Uncharacterized protein n=1 Tax=Morella rubra TaxID=262757 RepID=A0A6A1V997_9ROSI|nr:hypothetical protein CJ030_MR6G016503 [Morella rubra]
MFNKRMLEGKKRVEFCRARFFFFFFFAEQDRIFHSMFMLNSQCCENYEVFFFRGGILVQWWKLRVTTQRMLARPKGAQEGHEVPVTCSA